jgi:hypothetical protein
MRGQFAQREAGAFVDCDQHPKLLRGQMIATHAAADRLPDPTPHVADQQANGFVPFQSGSLFNNSCAYKAPVHLIIATFTVSFTTRHETIA